MSASLVTVRAARPEDLETVWRLILELAEYEQLSHECTGALEDLGRAMFGAQPRVEAILAFANGEPAGLAIYYFTFSTFAAKPILFLEDFFVRPSFRRQGAGRQMFRMLAEKARELDCEGMEWSVLDWNRLAMDFYASLGAAPRHEWVRYRLGPEQISLLAKGGALNEIGPEEASRPRPDAQQKHSG